jgi:CRISPR-associated endonuclease/helicase Cas3
VTKLPELQPELFPAFFHSLYRREPFRWQVRLAERACHGAWPRVIKLPTSSGKTTCLDIAVFALAHQACRRHTSGIAIDAPRRIFLVVDRRIVVNEGFNRANALKKRLKDAVDNPHSPLFPVAYWLRSLADNQHAPPLDCFELRGGIYRDDAWVRSLLQPTIVASTVDQIGSRLLFRGYGVSDCNLPIHAALTANDSLILLDEAHCSKPFSQTMEAIARYRDACLAPNDAPRWAQQPIRTPFRFVEMTATPGDDSTNAVFQLEAVDYQLDKSLDERHSCPKPIRLELSPAKGGRQNVQLAKDLVSHAKSLAKGTDSQPPCLRIAIVVNRVECARRAFELLEKDHGARVELMIGRMRPFDRDQLTKILQARFQSESQQELTEPHFLVATQCLEVGADFDFDGMVCQCASLDALRQRFGRLNRLGKSPHARGMIVMAEGDRAPRKPDPIYDESLPATWEWLERHSMDGVIDFGIRALDARLAEIRSNDPDDVAKLIAPALDAPVLMPAHLDLLCQTAPRPAVEPDVAPYLHGPNRGLPEVRICWRADLPEQRDHEAWLEECRQALVVCPPSSAECLSLPLAKFKAWLKGKDTETGDDAGDVIGEVVSDDSEFESASQKAATKPVTHRRGVVWSGRKCCVVSGSNEELKALLPNAVVVLPATAGGWTQLGYLPNAPNEPAARANGDKYTPPSAEERHDLARIDVASAAFAQARDRLILRVHENLMTSAADRESLSGLWAFVSDPNCPWHHRELLMPEEDQGPANVEPTEYGVASDLSSGRFRELARVRETLASKTASQVRMVRYPGGFALIGPRISSRPELPRASFDDEFDEHNLDADKRLSLADHLADVAAETTRLVENVGLESTLAGALIAAAERHDLGKADPRFQAMLLGSSLDVAYMQPKLWAKSARGATPRERPGGPSARGLAADQLPRGFRHEILSQELAQQICHTLDAESLDVMLHTIAAHHGHARPFAPVVVDGAPPDVSLRRLFPPSAPELTVSESAEQRLPLPAYRLDSGISTRFWKLNRRFGWWGLAWLESALRLADWVASAKPTDAPLKPRVLTADEATASRSSTRPVRLNCVGLNGANPLGFLAAIGMFRHVATELDCEILMEWEVAGGTWSPTLFGIPPELGSESKFLDWLFGSLQADPEGHWLKRLNELPEDRLGLSRPSAYSDAAEEAVWHDRIAADWLSCNGSELCEAVSNNQLQTARRDYFPENAVAIIRTVKRDHLERTLFRQWDYADPIHKVSLHLEPREDRRHAYQWHRPVSDPTRVLRGGMVGANRLAMEAWPLYQSVSFRGGLQTVGFQGTRPLKGILWTWPLWTVPVALCDLTPILNLEELQLVSDGPSAEARNSLLARGIGAAFRLRRILVEKTPNFTAPVAIFSGLPSARPTVWVPALGIGD